MQRQFSGASLLQSQKTMQMPRQRSRCCAIAEALDLVSWGKHPQQQLLVPFDENCWVHGS